MRLHARLAHPGNLLSPALSRALSPFVVAVVSGKDLIPRLSLNSLERLRDDMVTSLARCRWAYGGRRGWPKGRGQGSGGRCEAREGGTERNAQLANRLEGEAVGSISE